MVATSSGRALARAIALSVGLSAVLARCAAPEAVRRIERAHAGSTYEGSTTGCGIRSPTVRRFGADLRAAVLWARQVVHTARALPCEAVIDAVHGATREGVYRVWQDRNGAAAEGSTRP